MHGRGFSGSNQAPLFGDPHFFYTASGRALGMAPRGGVMLPWNATLYRLNVRKHPPLACGRYH